MSGFVSIILMPVRYFMIAGFAVLAIVFYEKLDLMSGGKVDFENILPAAIMEFAPVGIIGLLLAGLLAAFMSTFASTVNAAPAYLVNDIYKRYINPHADDKKLIYASYIVSVAVVVISTLIGLFVESINSVLQWLVSGLWGGYVVSNVLKWYWWRLNGMGYFWGMASGMLGAVTFPALFGGFMPSVASDILPLYLFPLLFVFSAIVCVGTSLLTKPDDEAVLMAFYKNVRPWGFWGPIHDRVVSENPDFVRNTNFKRDMFNIVVGIISQTALVALPIFIVVRETGSIISTLVVLVVGVLILKKTWYDCLEDRPKDDEEKLIFNESKSEPNYG